MLVLNVFYLILSIYRETPCHVRLFCLLSLREFVINIREIKPNKCT